MKKVIKRDKATGIVQITVSDERWYVIPDNKGEDRYVPSVTWICSYYPKNLGFMKWLASTGWDESQAIKNAAGDKGSRVHEAIVDLIDGKDIAMDAKYLNKSTEKMEELTLEEYDCLMSFVAWFDTNKVQVIAREIVVYNEEEGYAGTVDLICRIGAQVYIVDFKTSPYIWPEHELQINAYKQALAVSEPTAKMALLQVGYKRNKKGYKFTEIGEKFHLFMSAKTVWQAENENVSPKVKDYPTSLKLKGEE